jgi:glycerophosphoryl diester phosphodiesterase
MPVLNIAHRGGAGLRPENTLAAFAHAIALGADGAELDAQLTRDGRVVVFHDYRLKPDICRDANGKWLTPPTGKIVDLTLAQLQFYDIGRANPAGAYARAHPDQVPQDGERIPLLAEVVALARRAPRPFRLFVELKTSFADRSLSAPPEQLADAALKVLRAADFIDRTVLVGFDWPGLLHAKKLEPSVKCWYTTLAQSWFRDGEPPLADDPPAPPALQVLRYWAQTGTSPWAGGFDAVHYAGSIVKAIAAAGGDGWFPYFPDATAEAVAEARALGLAVGAWTVDDRAAMRTLIVRRVDAICTDRPDILMRVSENAE